MSIDGKLSIYHLYKTENIQPIPILCCKTWKNSPFRRLWSFIDMLIAIQVIMPRKSRIVDAEASHFKIKGQTAGQSGRKNRKKHGPHVSRMIHINISMSVPVMP